MSSKVFKINKAGLFLIGHTRTKNIRLMLGAPNTSCRIDLTDSNIDELLGVLEIKWEDGAFIQDLLEGQYVLVKFDEKGFIKSIGDPFGNKSICLGD